MKKKIHAYKCTQCDYTTPNDLSYCDFCRAKMCDRDSEVKKRKPSCTNCHKIFNPFRLYQLTCSDECENIQQTGISKAHKEKYDAICKQCGIKFRKPNARGVICEGCKRYNFAIYRNKLKKDPGKAWAEKKGGLSLDEQIRRMEWKRVMEDSGWDHFLKGNKWDKI